MTKKNIFPVVATIAVVGVVLGVFSTTVLRDSNVSISTMTSEQAYYECLPALHSVRYGG